MDSEEVGHLVDELETRLERLRALYDQYFMGIERMEPAVPRKDVERRFQTLRREQIRNTGLRFRFQMLLQRYNTYQTYWHRICRQIEDGTYKRHVARAQRLADPRPSEAVKVNAEKKEAETKQGVSLADVAEDFDLSFLDGPASPAKGTRAPALDDFEVDAAFAQAALELDPEVPKVAAKGPAQDLDKASSRRIWKKKEETPPPPAAKSATHRVGRTEAHPLLEDEPPTTPMAERPGYYQAKPPETKRVVRWAKKGAASAPETAAKPGPPAKPQAPPKPPAKVPAKA